MNQTRRTPKLMGILNVAPDSFYAPSSYPEGHRAIARGLELSALGADWIDVGGESTRPGSMQVDECEELRRVVPVVRGLVDNGVKSVSVDTCKPAVAEACLKAGATMINDISGFIHPQMRELAAASQAAICVMHMQGTPQTMQNQPAYPDGVIETILRWFDQQLDLLIQAGVHSKNIFLDPGIGFGKTVAHNVEILQNLPRFIARGYPLLLGVSRKSFMSRILNKSTAELLPATLAVNTLALRNGVDIIRVHDVAEHRAVIDLIEAMDGVGGLHQRSD